MLRDFMVVGSSTSSINRKDAEAQRKSFVSFTGISPCLGVPAVNHELLGVQ